MEEGIKHREEGRELITIIYSTFFLSLNFLSLSIGFVDDYRSLHILNFIRVLPRVHPAVRFLSFNSSSTLNSLKCNFICIYLSTIQISKSREKTSLRCERQQIFSLSVERVSRQPRQLQQEAGILVRVFPFGCCLLVSVNYLWRFGGYQLLCTLSDVVVCALVFQT